MARVAVVLIAAAAAIWAVLAATMSFTIGARSPGLLPGWGLSTAEVKAATAAGIVQSRPSPQEIARARTLAEAALRREPVNVTASRTLGFVALFQRDEAKAARLFRYAESLSRRDLPTQLWLIESRVARNDIQGALRHYDRALRASTSSRDLLEPILIQASADPAIGQPLAALLAVRPPWWTSFTERMIATEAPPTAALGLIVRRLRLDPSNDYERGLLAGALNRLVESGAYRLAYAIYREARGGAPPRTELVRNPDFSLESAIPPFEWQLHDTPGLAAVTEARDGAPEGLALSIIAENGRSGEVARELLMAPAGEYRLTAVAGAVPADEQARPAISVVCAGEGGAALARLRLPAAASSPARIAHRFRVPPSGCPAQWLRIESGASVDRSEELPPWVASLSVRPL